MNSVLRVAERLPRRLSMKDRIVDLGPQDGFYQTKLGYWGPCPSDKFLPAGPHTSLDGLTPREFLNRSVKDQTLNRTNFQTRTNWGAGQLQSFLPAINLWAEKQRRRQIRRSYGSMSDAQLRDIGLTSWDIETALSLPLVESAGDALAVAAAAEAARW